MVEVRVDKCLRTILELHECDSFALVLTIPEIDIVPSVDDPLMLHALSFVRLTSTFHIGVRVGWHIVKIVPISEGSEGTIPESLPILVLRLIVDGEPEHEVPITNIRTTPLEPTTD